MFVAARCNKSDRTRVLSTICVRMKTLVQIRRCAKRERPKKSSGNKSSHKYSGTRRCAAFH